MVSLLFLILYHRQSFLCLLNIKQPEDNIKQRFTLVTQGAAALAVYNNMASSLQTYGLIMRVDAARYAVDGDYIAAPASVEAPLETLVDGAAASPRKLPATGDDTGVATVTVSSKAAEVASVGTGVGEVVAETIAVAPVVTTAEAENGVVFGLHGQLTQLPNREVQLEFRCARGSVADFSRCVLWLRDQLRSLCRDVKMTK